MSHPQYLNWFLPQSCCFGSALCPRVSGENVHCNRKPSKTFLSRTGHITIARFVSKNMKYETDAGLNLTVMLKPKQLTRSRPVLATNEENLLRYFSLVKKNQYLLQRSNFLMDYFLLVTKYEFCSVFISLLLSYFGEEKQV